MAEMNCSFIPSGSTITDSVNMVQTLRSSANIQG